MADETVISLWVNATEKHTMQTRPGTVTVAAYGLVCNQQ